MKLSRKLTLNFIALIILSIIIISFISNIMINNRFEHYLINEREVKFQRISGEINELFSKNDFQINEMELVHYALAEDINLTIEDMDGRILYRSDSGKGMGHMGMMGNMHHGSRRRMMNVSPGKYLENSYPLIQDDSEVAKLIIGYIDNAYLTESALIFKSTLFKSFAISALIAILIGLIFSIILSNRLTNPLVYIRNTANEIQAGNLKVKDLAKTDVIEIKELSQALNYLAKSLDQQEFIRKRYASDISHELRTPLTTLKTHLEAIVDGVWEPNKEHLHILMDETERLSNLVDNLKDSFLEEEYNIEINKSNFNLSEEIKNIIIAFKPAYNQRNLRINSSIEDNIDAYMDRDKFKQVMNNLLSNSLRYMGEDGQLDISLQSFENNIKIQVRDNGHGIRKDDLPFLFDRFYRVDNSRDKTTGGSGLGLSIVKSIVEAHGGKIHVDSIYGEGTSFTIEFPK